ncbi:hypothetical protein O6H91_05G048600 [Diphasiastrum complanatum]|uniref:Uncharacterized protein n=1 Tax=Diphasiastrum complanatum TaxID=34168 RepID=A0ACC2DN29_DIPCM|nr:hypothetical protein O6H91_Y459400 [Diphasiastrum complanatum]KAJ7555649.1 hypothetical protein O6H91_05G048600 [Diphasiastrum complanatum]
MHRHRAIELHFLLSTTPLHLQKESPPIILSLFVGFTEAVLELPVSIKTLCNSKEQRFLAVQAYKVIRAKNSCWNFSARSYKLLDVKHGRFDYIQDKRVRVLKEELVLWVEIPTCSERTTVLWTTADECLQDCRCFASPTAHHQHLSSHFQRAEDFFWLSLPVFLATVVSCLQDKARHIAQALLQRG